MQPQVMRAFDSPYNETENLWGMEQILHGSMFNDRHHAGAAEIEDPCFLAPSSTLNTGSVGRPSHLPYIAGPFKQEYAPYFDEKEDMLFESTITLPFVAAQTQEWRRNSSELPVRAQQQGQMRSEQGRHPGIQIIEAVFPYKEKEGEDKNRLIKTSYIALTEQMHNFVPSPDPQPDTAAKRVKGE